MEEEDENQSHLMTTEVTTDEVMLTLRKLENENRQLRSRLEQSEHTMSEMSHQMELQKSRTRQLIAGWKIKLQEGEDKMVAHSKEKDDQLASLLSQLMYFEGCLKREREDITEELLSKTVKISDLEKTVKHQKKQIDALNRANERLLTSLHDTMNGRTGDASDESSSDDDSSSSSSNNSPVPMMVRRKASMPAAVTLTKLTNGNISNYSRPRQRKGVANGSTPTIHIVHVDSPDQQLSSDSTSPELTRRRVHFEPHLQNNNRGEDTDSDENKRKRNVRLRKISLPAYRLPSDEEGSIRYF
ncbi:uncharacterized protein [Amphiura filiformis]|uniref:uncharacterized protein isoform X2 n=1 Tax=Amphiura filiformis TaxID=82378 RepID=UPI003B2115BC